MILMLVCYSSRYGYEQRVSTNSRPAPPASNSSQYDRRVEKYERHEQPASRYTERRSSHEAVHRDRDDRRVAEARAPKYDRWGFNNIFYIYSYLYYICHANNVLFFNDKIDQR